MDVLGKAHVYFGESLMSTNALESFFNPWLQIPTPLGTLGMAGIIRNSQGTGFETYRVFHLHALVLLVEGGGAYRDEHGLNLCVRAGDCIRVRPGIAHQYGPEGGDRWTEVYVAASGPMFDDWYNAAKAGVAPAMVQPLGDPEVWLPRWLALIRSRPHSRNEVVETLAQLHQLYSELARREEHQTQAHPEGRLDHSRRLLESWPASSAPDWERLAAACHISYETWRKAFRATYGESPGRFRRRVLMERAADLLRRTSLTNEQLAEQFGCGDAFHFSKLFKSVHGLSPSECRRRNY